MSDKLKEVKAHTLDLAKVLSYLYELDKTKDQTYVTKEGMAFLEGVVLGGNDKVKVVTKSEYDRVESEYKHMIEEWKIVRLEKSELDTSNDKLRNENDRLKLKKKARSWFG